MSELAHPTYPSRWRVRWAIARKETRTVLLNNYYLIPLLMPLMMSLVFAVLFSAVGSSVQINLVIWDRGESQLVETLQTLPELNLTLLPDAAAFEAALDGATGGIIIPDGFDTAVAAGQAPELQVLLNAEARSSTQLRLQGLLNEQAWAMRYDGPPAILVYEEHRVSTQGLPTMSTNDFLLLVLVALSITMVSVSVLPQLMIEEKEKSTLPALLASPAGYGDLVMGKVGAALLIGLLAFLAILLVNNGFRGNWGATLLGSIAFLWLTLGLGVIFGLWSSSRSQCNAYAVFLVLFLNMPTWFMVANFDTLHPLVQTLLRLNPTTYYSEIVILSLNNQIAPQLFLRNMLILVGCTVAAFAVATWQFRHRPPAFS